MDQYNSGRHEGRARLNQEAAAQETVSVPVPEVHHGREPDEWHEDVMEDDEWTVSQELLDLPLADGDPVFGESWIDKVHRDAVVEEVRHSEDQIIVKNIESVGHDVSSALAVDEPANWAGTDCKSAWCNLVADVVDSIIGYSVSLTIILTPFGASQECLTNVADSWKK